eukprot:TRINITY_DN279_c0_g6_i1.p1 TRINITY_DN279_c0_g6~~TRINITY_DN279_c0_g6_i1.p1  ORF type:complete len:713 (-),score=88.90 TRINITY_DN279_c0_g6_i1:261-2399(-)
MSRLLSSLMKRHAIPLTIGAVCLGTVCTFRRNFLTLGTMAWVAADFKWTWWRYPEGSEKYESETEKLHERAASRILWLCETNQGLYIKVGQYMVNMGHVLPPVYIEKFKKLQDSAPSVPFPIVERVFLEDFGRPISSVFKEINPKPIAAASLAQVHWCKTKDGREVALKVQYPHLRKGFHLDMFTHFVVLHAAQLLFPSFQLTWMHDEMYNSLIKELDFVNEGRNAEVCRAYFLNDPRVYVPKIDWTLTSPRVLSMEYIHGYKITDIRGMEKRGIDSKGAAIVALDVLSRMIFIHAFVHADPHPGNLFVRSTPRPDDEQAYLWNRFQKKQEKRAAIYQQQLILQQQQQQIAPHHQSSSSSYPLSSLPSINEEHDDNEDEENDKEQTRELSSQKGKPPFELVILDHGLYRQLREPVRKYYCHLWKALVLRDDSLVEKYCRALGVTDWEAFAIIVLMRPYKAQPMGFARLTKLDAEEVRKQMQQMLPQLLAMMKMMPRELMLVLRNQMIARSLNSEFGYIANRFRMMARIALEGCYLNRHVEHGVVQSSASNLSNGNGHDNGNDNGEGLDHVNPEVITPRLGLFTRFRRYASWSCGICWRFGNYIRPDSNRAVYYTLFTPDYYLGYDSALASLSAPIGGSESPETDWQLKLPSPSSISLNSSSRRPWRYWRERIAFEFYMFAADFIYSLMLLWRRFRGLPLPEDFAPKVQILPL